MSLKTSYFGTIMRNNVIFQENLDISDMHICSLHEICSVTRYSMSKASTQKINKIKNAVRYVINPL